MKQSNTTKQRIPTGRRQTCWLLTCVVEDMNSGQLWTNPASGQGGLELGAYGSPVKRSNCSAALPSRLRPVYFLLVYGLATKRSESLSFLEPSVSWYAPVARNSRWAIFTPQSTILYLIKDSFSNNKKYYFFLLFYFLWARLVLKSAIFSLLML